MAWNSRSFRDVENPFSIAWANSSTVSAISWSPDSSKVAVTEKCVEIFSISNESRLISFLNTEECEDVKYSPNGRWIALAVGPAIQFRMAETGRLDFTIEPIYDVTQRISWSPDSNYIVSVAFDALEQRLEVWNVNTGQKTCELDNPSHDANCIAWSPNGVSIVGGFEEGMLRVWRRVWRSNVSSVVREFPGHSGAVHTVAWSPDSAKVVSAGKDCVVRTWDVATGTVLLQLEGHTQTVYCVDWSQTGRYILSASRDTTIRLWDSLTGVRKRIFTNHKSSVIVAAFSPNGWKVASSDLNKKTLVWNISEWKQSAHGFFCHYFQKTVFFLLCVMKVTSMRLHPDIQHVIFSCMSLL